MIASSPLLKSVYAVSFGNRVHRYDVLTSTQDMARDYARSGAEAGTAIIARTMTNGRGRLGRQWHTAPNANLNITFIGGKVETATLWQLSLVAGIATADAISDTVPELRPLLRFPNDILLSGKKVGGILIESVPEGKIAIPLIGIGINLLPAPLPPEVAERAINLQETTGHAPSVSALEQALFTRLTERWHEWQTLGLEELLPTYHAYHDPQARRNLVVDNAMRPCRVVRVFASGAVLLATEDGEHRAVHAAQIVFGDP